MIEPYPPPRFIVWRQDDNGVRAVVGACHGRRDAQAVVETLEARGHKQHYWVEENRGATTRAAPFLRAAPSLDALGRVTAPPVRLDVEPPWAPVEQITDPTGSLHFERPPGEGAARFLVSGLKFDVPVSFEAYVEHHWSSAGLGHRKYVPEELVSADIGGRPARGYDWGTGISEIFAWLIRASPELLIWASCEVYYVWDGGKVREAREVSLELLSRLVFLE